MFDTDLLKYYMSKSNIDKYDIANAINKKYSTVCRKLRGSAPLTVDEAKIICDICDITDNSIKSQIFLV